METRHANDRRARGFGVILAGALLAGLLGAKAGATLRLMPGERSAPPPPQLFVLPEEDLATLEQRSAGWPGRQPG